ncbi:MAG: hypothetical protein U1F68_04925 [Gammaproteobacteria bacterium]
MADSLLDPDALTPQGPVPGGGVGKGHGTRALGPSDSSDTGADIVGGPGLIDGDVLGLERGTNEDSEGGSALDSAGPSIGDSDLDADTDSAGTGERIGAGRDPAAGVNHDIGFDRIVDASEAGLGGGLDQAEEAQLGVPHEQREERLREDAAR